MSVMEQVVQELNSLDEVQLNQIAQYIAFLRHQSRLKCIPRVEETRLADLYRECAQEDRELAEEGLSDYVGALAREDAQ